MVTDIEKSPKRALGGAALHGSGTVRMVYEPESGEMMPEQDVVKTEKSMLDKAKYLLTIGRSKRNGGVEEMTRQLAELVDDAARVERFRIGATNDLIKASREKYIRDEIICGLMAKVHIIERASFGVVPDGTVVMLSSAEVNALTRALYDLGYTPTGRHSVDHDNTPSENTKQT